MLWDFPQSSSHTDTQWPELAKLICPNDEHSSSSRKFIDAGILGATDYWFRFEWQLRGSPHIHGIAWFPNAPDVEKLLATEDDSDLIAAVEDITSYADDVVSTTNPTIAMDGSNPETVPPPKIKPQHACNKPYKISAWTWLTLLPPANVTLGVHQLTVSGRKQASKSVALGTQNLCNKSPPSPQRTETPASSLQETTAYSVKNT